MTPINWYETDDDLTVADVQEGLALEASVTTLTERLTAARAGYLDNLSAGPAALAASVGTLVNSGGDPTLGDILGDVANSDIATRLTALGKMGQPSSQSSNYLAVTADLTSATWNTVSSHKTFDVTGTVRMIMWITCGSDVGSVGGEAALMFGTETDTDAFIASTDETELGAGDLWYDATPTTQWDTFGNCVMDYVITGGLDVGYEIDTEDCNAGSLTFHCVWYPMSSDGAVVAGIGEAMGGEQNGGGPPP